MPLATSNNTLARQLGTYSINNSCPHTGDGTVSACLPAAASRGGPPSHPAGGGKVWQKNILLSLLLLQFRRVEAAAEVRRSTSLIMVAVSTRVKGRNRPKLF